MTDEEEPGFKLSKEVIERALGGTFLRTIHVEKGPDRILIRTADGLPKLYTAIQLYDILYVELRASGATRRTGIREGKKRERAIAIINKELDAMQERVNIAEEIMELKIFNTLSKKERAGLRKIARLFAINEVWGTEIEIDIRDLPKIPRVIIGESVAEETNRYNRELEKREMAQRRAKKRANKRLSEKLGRVMDQIRGIRTPARAKKYGRRVLH